MWLLPLPLFNFLLPVVGLLGHFWLLLGCSGVAFRHFWVVPGRSWAPLGCSCTHLGCSWPPLGLSWPLLGRPWPLLGRSWAALGPLLGSSWLLLGRSWPLLGRPRGPLGRPKSSQVRSKIGLANRSGIQWDPRRKTGPFSASAHVHRPSLTQVFSFLRASSRGSFAMYFSKQGISSAIYIYIYIYIYTYLIFFELCL